MPPTSPPFPRSCDAPPRKAPDERNFEVQSRSYRRPLTWTLMGWLPPGTYGSTIKSIQSDIVTEAINRQAPSRVLKCAAPQLSHREKMLPRPTRAVMSHLRSGFCARLKDYLHRIGRAPDDIRPNCDLDPQTVKHLFDCPARPTTLSTEELWSSSYRVASFLVTHPAFVSLPPPFLQPPPLLHPNGQPPPAPPPSPGSGSLFSTLSIPSSSSFGSGSPGHIFLSDSLSSLDNLI